MQGKMVDGSAWMDILDSEANRMQVSHMCVTSDSLTNINRTQGLDFQLSPIISFLRNN